MRPRWLVAFLVVCSCTFDYGTLKGKITASDGAADTPIGTSPDGATVSPDTAGTQGSDAGHGGASGTGGVVLTGGTGGTVNSSGGTRASGGSGGTDTGGTMGTGGRTGSGGSVGTGGGAAGIMGSGGSVGTDGGVAGIMGSGGAIPTGGNAGTGGTTSCAPTRATGSIPVIDTMNDGDGAIPQQDGRTGGWYSFNDETGTQTPQAPSITAKTGWICSSGSGFESWGAAIGVSLNSDGTKSCTYDASIYKGVTFALQGSVAGGNLRFNVQTAEIATAAGGGTCVSSSVTDNCDDYFGAEILGSSFRGETALTCTNNLASWTCSTASPTSAFNLVTIPFAKTSQEGWGQSFPALDLTKVLQLHWEIKDYYDGFYYGPVDFQLCIGNVSFY